MVVVGALIPVVVSLDEVFRGVLLRVAAKGVGGVVASLVNSYLKGPFVGFHVHAVSVQIAKKRLGQREEELSAREGSLDERVAMETSCNRKRNKATQNNK